MIAIMSIPSTASSLSSASHGKSMMNMDVQLTRCAVIAIGWDAAQQKRSGAPVLRDTYRGVIRGLEFEPSNNGVLTI
jgi:hypothetical protein